MDIKTLFAGLSIASVCIGQSVNISGRVTDTSGTIPIPSAAVMLEQGGLTATTAGDGSFTLLGIISSIKGQNYHSMPHTLSITINNGIMYVNVKELSVVEIVTYNLHGQAIATVKKPMNIGTNCIALPSRGAGVYLHKVKSGNIEFVIKSHSIGGVSGSKAISAQGSSFTALAKQAYVPIDDVIKVTKDGYLNSRVIVTNPDTSGIEIKMLLQDAGSVMDIEGNLYHAIRIGDQVWTVENLRTTTYNDGTPITFDTSAATWSNATTEKYCYYNNMTNADSIKKFGALYNFYAVDTKKLAPTGWHVPTDAEWTTLADYLITNGYNWDGTTTDNKLAKSLAAKTDWIPDATPGAIGNDLTKNNSSGFSALPGGYRSFSGYSFIGSNGYWWSASGYYMSYAFYRYLSFDFDNLFWNYYSRSFGFSVRVARDGAY